MFIPGRDKKIQSDLTDGPESQSNDGLDTTDAPVERASEKIRKRRNRILESREERDARIEAEGYDPNPKKKSPKWKHKYGEVRGWQKRKKRPGPKPIHYREIKDGTIIGGIGADENRRYKPLNPRHAEVLDYYYLNGRDKRAAMIEAGYSESSAHAHSTIFNREDVKREMRRRDRYLARKYDVSEDRIIKELASAAFTGMGDFLKIGEDGKPYMDFSGATQEQMAAITKLKVTPAGVQFDLGDKMNALDKLARINGMFDDKVTVLGAEDAVAKLQAGRARMNKRREQESEETDDE